MADPISWAAIGSSVVGGGMSILQGFQQREMYKGRAMAAEREAQIAELQGKQVNAQRRDELNQALGAIDVLRSGRGVNLDSETGRAIRRDRRTRGQTAINNEVLGYRLGAVSKRNEASGYRSAGKWSVIQGFGRAIPKFAQAGSDFRSMREGS